jgi:threonine dehydrogenase-like Zn-dependent dehydrogenase
MEPYPETHFVVVQTEPFNIEVVSRPTPKLATPGDAIVRIEQSCLCGSDSHIYRGAQKGPYGYVMGHEFIGTLVQVGDDVQHFKVGERVVSPFTTSCGSCFFCDRGLTCRCVQSQLFGCRTLDGAQAEYVRVPLAGESRAASLIVVGGR